MTKQSILNYEIRASWWASYMNWPWAQKLASRYFAWKVNRKWKRYYGSVMAAQELERNALLTGKTFP